MSSENGRKFKVKNVRVDVEKLHLDSKTLYKIRSKRRAKEVIVISDDDDDDVVNISDEIQETNNNYDEKYELIGMKENDISENESNDEKRQSLILKIRRKRAADPEPSIAVFSVPGEEVEVHSKKTDATITTTTITSSNSSSSQDAFDFRKERRALLQRLRQQEINSLKKGLREMLPEDLRNQTRLEALSLANNLRTFCLQLEAEVGRQRIRT